MQNYPFEKYEVSSESEQLNFKFQNINLKSKEGNSKYRKCHFKNDSSIERKFKSTFENIDL